MRGNGHTPSAGHGRRGEEGGAPPVIRLSTPLIRREGALQPASWDEALDLVAARMGEIKRQHGGNAFGFFSCSKATNEVNYVAQKFARTALDSNNIDSCNRT